MIGSREQRLRIGELADRADVSVQTVRYYERRGLIEEPRRSAGGFREYPPATVTRLRFVRRAQRLGFSLSEIGELLQLRARTDEPCKDVMARIDAKLSDIDRRVTDLERIRRALVRFRAQCEKDGGVGECPTLEALEADGEDVPA